MLESVQLSDIMGIDILGNLSAQYYDQVKSFGFPDFSSLAPKMEWYFLSTTLDPAMLTPDMKFLPNMTYDDAPRDLDYLIIGGPLISHRPAAADKFMKEAFPKVKVILTTCIGSIWLASSGVLDGMKATTNRGFLGMAKQMYPGIEWLDQRWVVDGKVWTAGGAQAGESSSSNPSLIMSSQPNLPRNRHDRRLCIEAF